MELNPKVCSYMQWKLAYTVPIRQVVDSYNSSMNVNNVATKT